MYDYVSWTEIMLFSVCLHCLSLEFLIFLTGFQFGRKVLFSLCFVRGLKGFPFLSFPSLSSLLFPCYAQNVVLFPEQTTMMMFMTNVLQFEVTDRYPVLVPLSLTSTSCLEEEKDLFNHNSHVASFFIL